MTRHKAAQDILDLVVRSWIHERGAEYVRGPYSDKQRWAIRADIGQYVRGVIESRYELIRYGANAGLSFLHERLSREQPAFDIAIDYDIETKALSVRAILETT